MCVSVILCKRERYCHFACALSLHRLSPKKYKYKKKETYHIVYASRLSCTYVAFLLLFGDSVSVLFWFVICCRYYYYCCLLLFFFRGPTTKKCVFSKNYKQKHKVSTSMLCKQKITDRHESHMFVKIKNLISQENFDVWIWGYLRFYCVCVCLFFFGLDCVQIFKCFLNKRSDTERKKTKIFTCSGIKYKGLFSLKFQLSMYLFFLFSMEINRQHDTDCFSALCNRSPVCLYN